MSMRKIGWIAGVVVAGCASSKTTRLPEGLSVTGPFVHENMAAYVIEDPRAEDVADFLTLEEGLASGSVTISEKEQAEVHELVVENRSERPLFLQAGDLLKGGQQDRAIGADLVVPPRSGPQPVPAFCVERGRWNGGTPLTGACFSLEEPKAQIALRDSKDQGELWRWVAEHKRKVAGVAGLDASKTDSVNEESESAPVLERVKGFESAFGDLLRHRPHACGVVIAVNGRLETAHLYTGPRLFAKLFRRIIRSAALEASTNPSEEPRTPPRSDEAGAFLTQARKGEERIEKLAPNLEAVACENERSLQFSCRWGRTILHVETLRK